MSTYGRDEQKRLLLGICRIDRIPVIEQLADGVHIASAAAVPRRPWKGWLLQMTGVAVLLISLRRFFVLEDAILYFLGVIVGVIVFAVCLFGGGSLVKQSKEQNP